MENYINYDVWETYSEDLKFRNAVARSSRKRVKKVWGRSTNKNCGKIVIYNLFDRVMSAKEFLKLSDIDKLKTIEEYKVRHGLNNASLEMGMDERWLYNRRAEVLRRLKRDGIDSNEILNEYRKSMKVNRNNIKKREEKRRKREEKYIR